VHARPQGVYASEVAAAAADEGSAAMKSWAAAADEAAQAKIAARVLETIATNGIIVEDG